MIVSTLGLRKIPAILNSHVWGGLDRKFEFGWKGLVLPCRGMGNTSLHDPGAALALRAKFILISKLVFTSGSRESAGWLPPLRHRAFPVKMRGSKSPAKFFLIIKLLFTSGSREYAGCLLPLRHRAFPVAEWAHSQNEQIFSHH